MQLIVDLLQSAALVWLGAAVIKLSGGLYDLAHNRTGR